MPALPPVPGVLAIVLTMTLGEDMDAVNRFHVKYSSITPSDADLVAIATASATSWGTDLAPSASAYLALTSIDITDLTSPTAAAGGWSGSIPGTYTGGSLLTASTAARINRQISRRYRGGKPGLFFPVTDADFLHDPQTLTTGYHNQLQTGWADFEDDVNANYVARRGGTCASVSVSYYEGFTTFTTPSGRVRNIPTVRTTPVVDQVLDVAVNPKVASQRRRNLTRG